MNEFAPLLSLLFLLVPVLSLAGIAASATAGSHRWVYGVLGWIGWLVTVALAMFVGFIAVAFSCWGSNRTAGCGDEAGALVLLAGGAAAVLPGVLAYGLTRPARAGQ